MKVTEPGLNKLIDNLNTLICEDSLLTRQERETLVRAVAAIGAMKARVGMKKPAIPASSKPKEEKQPPVPDPRFPNARQAWVAEEETLSSGRSRPDHLPSTLQISPHRSRLALGQNSRQRRSRTINGHSLSYRFT